MLSLRLSLSLDMAQLEIESGQAVAVEAVEMEVVEEEVTPIVVVADGALVELADVEGHEESYVSGLAADRSPSANTDSDWEFPNFCCGIYDGWERHDRTPLPVATPPPPPLTAASSQESAQPPAAKKAPPTHPGRKLYPQSKKAPQTPEGKWAKGKGKVPAAKGKGKGEDGNGEKGY